MCRAAILHGFYAVMARLYLHAREQLIRLQAVATVLTDQVGTGFFLAPLYSFYLHTSSGATIFPSCVTIQFVHVLEGGMLLPFQQMLQRPSLS